MKNQQPPPHRWADRPTVFVCLSDNDVQYSVLRDQSVADAWERGYDECGHYHHRTVEQWPLVDVVESAAHRNTSGCPNHVCVEPVPAWPGDVTCVHVTRKKIYHRMNLLETQPTTATETHDS